MKESRDETPEERLHRLRNLLVKAARDGEYLQVYASLGNRIYDQPDATLILEALASLTVQGAEILTHQKDGSLRLTEAGRKHAADLKERDPDEA